MHRDKKLRERKQLDWFLSKQSGAPRGTPVEGEAPDFILETSTGRIGIELTDVLGEAPGGESQRAREAMEDRVLDAFVREWTRAGRRPIHLTVGFHSLVSKRRCSAVTAALYETLSLASLKWKRGVLTIDNDWARDGALPEEVGYVLALRHRSLIKTDATTTRTSIEVSLTPEAVQAVMDKKDRLSSTYARNCNEAWLVLVLEGYAPSSAYDVNDLVLSHHYRSGFGRLFLCDLFGGRSHELQRSN